MTLIHPGQQIAGSQSQSIGSNFSMEANHGHSFNYDSEGTGRSSPQVGEFDGNEPKDVLERVKASKDLETTPGVLVAST